MGDIERTQQRQLDKWTWDHDPTPTPRTARYTEDRLSDLIERIRDTAHSPEVFSNMSAKGRAPSCSFEDADHVAACPREAIPGATPYLKGAGDVDEVDPNDVKQRSIPNCAIMASLVALARLPKGREILKSMVKEVRKPDGKVVYQVTIRSPHLGEDPFDPSAGRKPPSFSTKTIEVPAEFIRGHAAVGDAVDGKQEIWPLAIEAAFAIEAGGYDKLTEAASNTSGPTAWATLSRLTGVEATRRFIKDDFSPLLEGQRQGLPMTIGFEGEDLSAYGMHAGHAYAVDGVFVNNGELYVRLVNPWGQDDPKLVPVRELQKRDATVTLGHFPP